MKDNTKLSIRNDLIFCLVGCGLTPKQCQKLTWINITTVDNFDHDKQATTERDVIIIDGEIFKLDKLTLETLQFWRKTARFTDKMDFVLHSLRSGSQPRQLSIQTINKIIEVDIMNTKQLLNMLRMDGDSKSPSMYDLCINVMRKAEYEQLPRIYYDVAYEIVCADQRCLISGLVRWWIMGLTNQQKCKLIVEIANTSVTDVPKFLTEKWECDYEQIKSRNRIESKSRYI